MTDDILDTIDHTEPDPPNAGHLEHHDYTSTACYHREHHLCRLVCKFCQADCACCCHHITHASVEDSAIVEPGVGMSEPTLSDLEALLRIFAFDDTDELWWRGRDGADTGPLEFYVNVNDAFTWGCADVERIDLPSDLGGLAQAKADTLPATYGWPTLWAARKRQERPQSAIYKHLPENIWSLLNACGPERQVASPLY